jgi:hypothetical protein
LTQRIGSSENPIFETTGLWNGLARNPTNRFSASRESWVTREHFLAPRLLTVVQQELRYVGKVLDLVSNLASSLATRSYCCEQAGRITTVQCAQFLIAYGVSFPSISNPWFCKHAMPERPARLCNVLCTSAVVLVVDFPCIGS